MPETPTPRVKCRKCRTCFDGTIELCESHSKAVNDHETLLELAKLGMRLIDDPQLRGEAQEVIIRSDQGRLKC
jgi:hypothetical protein